MNRTEMNALRLDAPSPQVSPLIPVAIERRLILNFLGFRLRGGTWVRDQLCLDEELVDCMDPETWEAAVTSWRQPGAQVCESADGNRPMAECSTR